MAAPLGVTLDGYAVEGGYDVEGGPMTSFSVAQSLGLVAPSMRTPSVYEQLAELARSSARLGFSELRLTVEWARIEPRPNVVDDAALAHYRGALAAARDARLDCVLVLCDVALPSWMGQEPWLSAWAPERFASHAERVALALGDQVRSIITFRAPNAAARDGWRDAARPPFRSRARADEHSALDGMLLAHQLAARRIAAVRPDVEVGLVRELSAGDEPGDVELGTAPDLAPRSHAGWADGPPTAWWIAGEDPVRLAAAVQGGAREASGVELGAGRIGWDLQLGAVPALRAALGASVALHLSGLVAATAPVRAVSGLLALDLGGGNCQVLDDDGRLARRLAGLS